MTTLAPQGSKRGGPRCACVSCTLPARSVSPRSTCQQGHPTPPHPTPHPTPGTRLLKLFSGLFDLVPVTVRVPLKRQFAVSLHYGDRRQRRREKGSSSRAGAESPRQGGSANSCNPSSPHLLQIVLCGIFFHAQYLNARDGEPLTVWTCGTATTWSWHSSDGRWGADGERSRSHVPRKNYAPSQPALGCC